MRKTIILFGLLACIALLNAAIRQPTAVGQTVSGFPGDGIPDIYYFPTDGSVDTSLGVIDRPAGTLTVDTDGTDMVGVSVSGADVSLPPACDLCDGFNLPDPNAPPFFISTWAVVFLNETTSWIRTTPLDTDGFVGVVGEDKIFAIVPTHGLANYGPGLNETDFPRIFADDDPQTSELFNVVYVTHASGTVWTDVTIVPEPNGWLLVLFAVSCVIAVRKPTLQGIA